MLRLHLTRALLAAAITSAMAPSFLLVWITVAELWRTGTFPSPGLFKSFSKAVPDLLAIFGVLVLIVAGPMTALWILPLTRRWFRHPWAAAIAGAIIGMLLSRIWIYGVPLVTDSGHIDDREFFRMLPFYLTLSAATGAPAAFLHAFFIQRALAKRKWLETHPEHNR